MGRTGRMRIERELAWDVQAEVYLGVFRRLLQAQPGDVPVLGRADGLLPPNDRDGAGPRDTIEVPWQRTAAPRVGSKGRV
jgi:hypothetical protein